MSGRHSSRDSRNHRPVLFRGRPIEEKRIKKIREVIAANPSASRTELSHLLCRLWNWRRPNGELRVQSCRSLLVRLHDRGEVELPPPRTSPGKRSPVLPPVEESEPLPAPFTECARGLKQVEVRLIRASERGRWDQLMASHHYLGLGGMIGESLRYVAVAGEEWLALSGWAAAAMKIRLREEYVGWDAETRWQRLYLVANHVRFLVLPWVKVPNLASFVLARNLRRLSDDWNSIYAHPVLLAETFVDRHRFRGTCYRAANWSYLGETWGAAKRGSTYRSHGNPKGLFVYPLHPRCRELLSGPLPPALPSYSKEQPMVLDASQLPLEGHDGLMDVLSQMTDPRKKQGQRHPYRSVLALAVLAVLSGAKSFLVIAEYAADLSWDTLKRLGFRRKDWGAPSEPTIRRVLQATAPDELDEKMGAWVARQTRTRQKGVAIDGKTMRGSGDGEKKPFHLFSAVLHEEGLVLGQEIVHEKTNEISATQPLLDDMDLQGSVVTSDAMHTQKEFAKYLLEEKKADYVFIAKENQPTLREDIELLDWESFPPNQTEKTLDKGHGRIETREIHASDELAGYLQIPYARAAFRIKRHATNLKGELLHQETVYGLSSLAVAKVGPAELLQHVRLHWGIENKVHYVRDVTFDEDRSQIRKRNGAPVMATLRNLALTVIRLTGVQTIAKALRHCSRHLEDVLGLIGLR